MSETQPQNVAYPGLFLATYYVNPGFTGPQAGSQSNPFTTIAAAFAAAAALALSGATIYTPPAVTITENIVFPSDGGEWEIATLGGYESSTRGARITGSVTCDTTSGNGKTTLTNFIVNGNINGTATGSGFVYLRLNAIRHVGALTVAGPSVVFFDGAGVASADKQGGSTTAAVSVSGIILATNWVFQGSLTQGAGAGPFTPSVQTQFRGCQFGAVNGSTVAITLGANEARCNFAGCYFTGPTTITTTVANYLLEMDGVTLARLQQTGVGLTLSGTNISLATLDSNASNTRTLTGNLGGVSFGARNVAGLYEVVVDETLLVAGTAGALQANVIYTDMTGTLVTVPVGTALNIAGAVGSKAQGSLQFQHNGAATPIAFSYTGIVTPGTMSVAAAVAIQRRN